MDKIEVEKSKIEKAVEEAVPEVLTKFCVEIMPDVKLCFTGDALAATLAKRVQEKVCKEDESRMSGIEIVRE